MLSKKYDDKLFCDSDLDVTANPDTGINILLTVKNRIADPYPAFHLNVDPDPTSRFNIESGFSSCSTSQSDVNLQPLVYRSSTSKPPL
jgi:hypothetical protein